MAMDEQQTNLASASDALKATCEDYKAACVAHEAHRDTMQYESTLEALEKKVDEEQADLLLALAESQQALLDALREHLRIYHGKNGAAE